MPRRAHAERVRRRSTPTKATPIATRTRARAASGRVSPPVRGSEVAASDDGAGELFDDALLEEELPTDAVDEVLESPTPPVPTVVLVDDELLDEDELLDDELLDEDELLEVCHSTTLSFDVDAIEPFMAASCAAPAGMDTTTSPAEVMPVTDTS